MCFNSSSYSRTSDCPKSYTSGVHVKQSNKNRKETQSNPRLMREALKRVAMSQRLQMKLCTIHACSYAHTSGYLGKLRYQRLDGASCCEVDSALPNCCLKHTVNLREALPETSSSCRCCRCFRCHCRRGRHCCRCCCCCRCCFRCRCSNRCCCCMRSHDFAQL